MAYSVIDKNPNVRAIVVDAAEDMDEININKFAPGSTCFVIEDKVTYMLSNAGEGEDISSEESEENEEEPATGGQI